MLALPFPLAVHPSRHLQLEPWTISVKILHKTTRSSKILHQTTLKLQFTLTTSPTPIILRKMTLPTKIPHKTTKSARKLVPNNKFPIAKLRVPARLKILNYYPEPNQISRFHNQSRPKPTLRTPKHHQTRLQQRFLHLDLYNAFPRQFSTL